MKINKPKAKPQVRVEPIKAMFLTSGAKDGSTLKKVTIAELGNLTNSFVLPEKLVDVRGNTLHDFSLAVNPPRQELISESITRKYANVEAISSKTVKDELKIKVKKTKESKVLGTIGKNVMKNKTKTLQTEDVTKLRTKLDKIQLMKERNLGRSGASKGKVDMSGTATTSDIKTSTSGLNLRKDGRSVKIGTLDASKEALLKKAATRGVLGQREVSASSLNAISARLNAISKVDTSIPQQKTGEQTSKGAFTLPTVARKNKIEESKAAENVESYISDTEQKIKDIKTAVVAIKQETKKTEEKKQPSVKAVPVASNVTVEKKKVVATYNSSLPINVSSSVVRLANNTSKPPVKATMSNTTEDTPPVRTRK